jgi:hypothetical protein
MTKPANKDQVFDPKEAQNRFEKTLRAALSTKPQPHSEKPKTRQPSGKSKA